MSEVFLPKPSRPPPIVIVLLLLSFILILIGGYYLYIIGKVNFPSLLKTKQNQPVSLLPAQEYQKNVEKQAAEGLQDYQKLKQEIKNQEAVTTEISNSCRQIPTGVDLQAGLTRQENISDGIDDYFYTGRIISFEEKNINNCSSYILTLFSANINFPLYIPKNLLGKTDLGETSSIIYKDYVGKRVEIKIRYEKDLNDSSIVKILEWQPTVFYSN